MRIETVTIHHPETLAEAEVPPETADSWTAQGWLPGPFPHADGRPPKNGAGSGLEAWQSYATAREIAYPADASRADIIALVEHLDQVAPPLSDEPVDAPLTAGEPAGATAPVGADPNPEEGDHNES